MRKLQPARGTRDIRGEEARRMRRVTDAFERVAARYGFEPVSTPIFEFAEVYARPLGESSDIVSKEMYSFTDRGGEALTLRPEFTAGIARAFISGGWQQGLPCRLMSHGPLFRYERPQKGRFRQFHQINAELIGASDPLADAEMIALAWRLLQALGVADKVTLTLNTLGDAESRARYRERLVAYYEAHRGALSEDSLARLAVNPLRILDSKSEADRAVNAGAPLMADSLADSARAFFDRLCDGLQALDIPFQHDPRLVRGLDYYTHTAFEFVTDALGAQGTVIGGGRYDGLIHQLGGPDTPAVGFAGGIERLALLLDAKPGSTAPLVLMPMGEAARLPALALADRLRRAGLAVVIDAQGALGKRLRRADTAGAVTALILGEEELASGQVTVRALDTGTQDRVAQDRLAEQLGASGG